MKRHLVFHLFFWSQIVFGAWSSNPAQPSNIGTGIQPQIAVTTNQHVYIAWLTDGSFHIYMQHLDEQGDNIWSRGGQLISAQPNSSWIAIYHLNLLADTQGNAVISTVDTRSGNWEVYTYKISPEGEHLWPTSGIQLSASGTPNISPRSLLIPSDNSVVITWTDNYSRVRMQRVSADGNLLWGENGIILSDLTASFMSPQARLMDDQLWVQWVSQTGSFPALISQLMVQAFDLDGNALSSAQNLSSPVSFPLGNWLQGFETDGAGGSYSSWTELGSVNQTAKINHVNPSGSLSWLVPLELSTQSDHFRISPRIARPPGGSEVYAVWGESNGDQNQRGVFAQRVDLNGTRLWGNTGVAIEALNPNAYTNLLIATAGSDAVFVYAEESTPGSGTIYATRTSTMGSTVWTTGRVTVSAQNVGISDLALSDEASHFYLAWVQGGEVKAQCLLASGALGIPPSVEPGIILVPEDFASIQSAIDAAVTGDTILVAPGTYEETLNLSGKDVLLSSYYFYEDDTSYVTQTVIDAAANGPCIILESGESAACQIQGFTLINGRGYVADPDGDGSSTDYGGAIYCKGSSPRFEHLRVRNSSVVSGGGGGLFVYDGSPLLSHVEFTGNSSADVGGAIYARHHAHLEILDSRIDGNVCADVGGALYARDSSHIVIKNTEIVNNLSDHAGAALGFKNGCEPLLQNVTLTGNVAEHFGGALYSNASTLAVVNSILWLNGNNEIHFADFDDPSLLFISHSDVSGGIDSIQTSNNGDVIYETSNLSQDPIFIQGPSGPYHLHLNSPARDAGTAYLEWMGRVLVDLTPESYADVAPDMGANESQAYGVDCFVIGDSLEWRYESSTADYVIQVGEEIIIADTSYRALNGWNPGVPNLYWFRQMGNTVYTRLSDADQVYLDFNRPPGSSWNIRLDPNSMSTMTLVAVDQAVETPLGSFSGCYHFSFFIAEDYSFEEWYAPGVGLVQRDVITIAGAERFSLVSFGPAVSQDPAVMLPLRTELLPAYPNPFNPTCVIEYTLAEPTPVSLRIYDIQGRLVLEQRETRQAKGKHRIQVDGSRLDSGIYMYQLLTSDYSASRKMLLLK